MGNEFMEMLAGERAFNKAQLCVWLVFSLTLRFTEKHLRVFPRKNVKTRRGVTCLPNTHCLFFPHRNRDVLVLKGSIFWHAIQKVTTER
jgi:hypothetical protein